MFAGNALGQFLTLMVVYKAKDLYVGWTEGGPKKSVYDVTPNGWFDAKTFEQWFFEVFLPGVEGKTGTKVIIGDNLGSHFSPAVIDYPFVSASGCCGFPWFEGGMEEDSW